MEETLMNLFVKIHSQIFTYSPVSKSFDKILQMYIFWNFSDDVQLIFDTFGKDVSKMVWKGPSDLHREGTPSSYLNLVKGIKKGSGS